MSEEQQSLTERYVSRRRGSYGVAGRAALVGVGAFAIAAAARFLWNVAELGKPVGWGVPVVVAVTLTFTFPLVFQIMKD